jgi:hypothetical protein
MFCIGILLDLLATNALFPFMQEDNRGCQTFDDYMRSGLANCAGR